MGTMSRAVLAALVLLNFSMFAVVLGFSAWLLNRNIDNEGYGGNRATPFLCQFALLSGMVGIASAITGVHHVRVGSTSSAAASQATSWITWLLLVLCFCLAWKEIRTGGRSVRHRVLEAFVITLTVTKFAETLAYYLEDNLEDETANNPATNSTDH